MNLVNRIAIILLILAAMLLIPLLLIFPEQAESALRYAADIVEANLVWLNGLSPAAEIGVRVLLGGAGLFVFIIGLLFLGLEVVRIRRKTVRLKDGSGELMMDGISGHVAYYVDLLSDVLRVRPTVTSKGKSIEAQVYVETAPGINIPAKTSEIKETVRRVIEEELGLQLKGEVKVTIRPVYPKNEMSRKRGPKQAPLQAARPAAMPEPARETAWEDYTPPLEAPEPEEPASELIEVKAPSAEEPAEE
ncbi:MAG: hypothetical protein JW934_13335 [Anaerolineae bacterium]|nr:hypothetical protein [Anaerolineae bacterium]